MKHHLSRRTLLRGMGVTMALPWMESRAVWGDESLAKSSDPASQAPVRVAVLFSGSGFHAGHWWAKGAGKEMELGPVLEPLSDFREKLLFVGGLYNEQALKGNIHSSQTGNMLSGAPLADGGEITGVTGGEYGYIFQENPHRYLLHKSDPLWVEGYQVQLNYFHSH